MVGIPVWDAPPTTNTLGPVCAIPTDYGREDFDVCRASCSREASSFLTRSISLPNLRSTCVDGERPHGDRSVKDAGKGRCMRCEFHEHYSHPRPSENIPKQHGAKHKNKVDASFPESFVCFTLLPSSTLVPIYPFDPQSPTRTPHSKGFSRSLDVS